MDSHISKSEDGEEVTDTWVVNNQSTSAAINYGDYEWKNADAKHLINSELVEAEGIYTGYKYYETRYADAVLGRGDASSAIGSSNGGVWDLQPGSDLSLRLWLKLQQF